MKGLIASDPWTRLAALGFAWLAFLAAAVWLYLTLGPASHGLVILSDVLAAYQDLVPALAFAVVLAIVALPVVRTSEPVTTWLDAVVGRLGGLAPVGLALAVGATGFVGWKLVFQSWPLSGDEMWAAFDTDIFRHGDLMAAAPAQWRPFVHALQPVWAVETPDHAYWASSYLPMNAALAAMFGVLGSPALAGPAWSALSVVLVWRLARRLWPHRPDVAVVAAVLLASSAQLAVTAMTPYAMPAHLALNLAWLSLFLMDSAWAQAGAIAVAFVATGLHQWLFNPMFALPFIAQAYFDGRRRRAILHAAAYEAIVFFWIAWPWIEPMLLGYPFAMRKSGAEAYALANALSPLSPGVNAENLLRLTTWLAPLAAPLALSGGVRAWRARSGLLWPMAAGVILILAFLIVFTPFQGHGWGWRYLHGYLGSLALLAAGAWRELTETPEGRRRGWAALAVSTLAAVAIFLPLRGWQAHRYAAPSASEGRQIAASGAQVVIVDADSLWFGMDLVRNDPFLDTWPKVMRLDALSQQEIISLCAHYRTRLLFGPGSSWSNLAEAPPEVRQRLRALRALASAPPCAPPLAAAPEPPRW